MNKKLIHFIFWVAFFFLWKRIGYFYIESRESQYLFTFLDVSSIIFPFYIIYLFVVPRFLKSKKFLFVISFLLAALVSGLVFTTVMRFALNNSLFSFRFNFVWNYEDVVFNRYLIGLLGAVAGLIAKLSFDWIINQKRIAQLEHQNTLAELNNLKSQVQPHFLFNLLNTIYVQVNLSPSEAQYSIHKLSHLLRYQLYECNAERVPLKKEISYLEDYIHLQRLRLEKEVRVQVKKDITENEYFIAPYILINFLENAFKHFFKNDSEQIIKIDIRVVDAYLHFSVVNSKTAQTSGMKKNEGIGLKNIKRRLELIYAGKYDLRMRDLNQYYHVDLKIKLDDKMPDR